MSDLQERADSIQQISNKEQRVEARESLYASAKPLIDDMNAAIGRFADSVFAASTGDAYPRVGDISVNETATRDLHDLVQVRKHIEWLDFDAAASAIQRLDAYVASHVPSTVRRALDISGESDTELTVVSRDGAGERRFKAHTPEGTFDVHACVHNYRTHGMTAHGADGRITELRVKDTETGEEILSYVLGWNTVATYVLSKDTFRTIMRGIVNDIDHVPVSRKPGA